MQRQLAQATTLGHLRCQTHRFATGTKENKKINHIGNFNNNVCFTRCYNSEQKILWRNKDNPAANLALAASQHKDPLNLFKRIVKLGSRTGIVILQGIPSLPHFGLQSNHAGTRARRTKG
ncbi:hypothetical protein Glove_680g24 [Diversispora epigaea]|uniref:Uncharacterized protein n=1 Tax=Diversispora epigaea TaxID=1348612 RepID=A0A397G352_9GLOM|nr:hypothetical protein Glove_680g24 [Diversispora epigaea]